MTILAGTVTLQIFACAIRGSVIALKEKDLVQVHSVHLIAVLYHYVPGHVIYWLFHITAAAVGARCGISFIGRLHNLLQIGE